VLVTVGAMEGLMATILTVVDRGDEVILPSPTYASHIEQVLLAPQAKGILEFLLGEKRPN